MTKSTRPPARTAHDRDELPPDRRFHRIIAEGKCIGCGLCASMFPRKLKIGLDPTGYLRPQLQDTLTDSEVEAIYDVCPGVVVTGMPAAHLDDDTDFDEVWGPWRTIARVHAADAAVRHEGATSGSLTALAQYLIDSGTAKSVLHIRTGGEQPSLGEPLVSRSSDDVRDGRGSCYAPAAPLKQFVQQLDKGELFAVVAKPCDISAVRRYARHDARVDELVTHCLTMVCGGIMPPFAFDAFLERVNVDASTVAAISYRGYGCPGPTRITLKNGDVIDHTYVDFWGTEASMWHLPWRCKICPDGTGEAADLAALDTWPGGTPTEVMMANDPGTNACITRTASGETLLRDAIDAGYLCIQGDATIDELGDWQPHQVKKKYECSARFDGMRESGHLGIETVNLNTSSLRNRAPDNVTRSQVRGTVERIAVGKHRDSYGVNQ